MANTSSYGQLPDTCEEVIVKLSVEKLPLIEVASIVCDENVYISVNELFGFSKVKYAFVDPNYNIMEGFIADPSNTYIIDNLQNEIIYKTKRYNIEDDDIIISGSNMYLKLSVLDTVFKFTSEFIYRDLTIVTSSSIELPAMKEARILERRLNIAKITNTSFKGDTLIRRKRPLYDFGAITYAANFRQQTNGLTNNRFNIAAGGQLLGGDFETRLVANTNAPITLRNFANTYRYVNNDLEYFKQLELGNISIPSIATLFTPVIGFQLTNRSTQLRNSFETYLLADYTEPFWTVELYVNNVLIDYTEADASGYYAFNVPIIYGKTDVRLRFFGQFGEEETELRSINVPYSFLPPNEFEYQVSAGFFSGETGSAFAQIRTTYGLTRFLTLGAGSEFYKLDETISYYPYLSSSLKVLENLIVSSEYAYRTQFKTSINYFTTSRFNAQLQFIEQSSSQNVILSGARRQAIATFSVPTQYRFITGNTRLLFNYRSNAEGFYTTDTQLIYSGQIFGLTSNLSTTVLKSKGVDARYRIRALTSFEIYDGFTMTPEILYEASEGQINYARVRIRKPVFERGLVDFNYTRTFFGNDNQFSLGFRYDFDFARAGVDFAVGNLFSVFNQNISGGALLDDYDNTVNFSRNNNLNRASLRFIPFIDLNNNNVKDPNERLVRGLGGKINKGRLGKQKQNGYLEFNSLEPYLDYYIELDDSGLESVAYKLDKQSYNITLSPSKITNIEVPVKVTGEVAGYVFRLKNNQYQPFSRIKVNILDENLKTVATVLTEFDGYFSYLGLPSGNYTARIDYNQLRQIYYTANERIKEFTMDNSNGGDILDNLEFYLEPKDPEYDIFKDITKYFRY